jgi:SAM-dependent methyltransferase
MLENKFNQSPLEVVKTANKDIFSFNTGSGNIDHSVVNSFGEEWTKFGAFSDAEVEKLGKMYFDILTPNIINKNTYGIDIGCGTGRFTKYLADKIGFMEAVDPSQAIFTANKLLVSQNNVRLSIASTDNIPFADETFDFGMSIGVLHHIPDTQKALSDCVKKIKIDGHFFTYLYYSLDNKGFIFKMLLGIVTAVRSVTSKLPSGSKKLVCDLIAILFYMPFVLTGRFFRSIGLKKLAESLPLSPYQDLSFFVIRNDALDRFGTSLEQRFSREEVIAMMKNAGLENIVVSENVPYWHAVGQRKK